MPATVEVCDSTVTAQHIDEVFILFTHIDETFSPYKDTSEISRLNRSELTLEQLSPEVQDVLRTCEGIKQETQGYFDVYHNGSCDPSGYVKGWAIQQAADYLHKQGFSNFFVEIAGDLQTAGLNSEGKPWQVGIRNPFNLDEIVKVLSLSGKAGATSGSYLRGAHIYNPLNTEDTLGEVVSLTVVGDRIVEADTYATAAFAMGTAGVSFIAGLPDFEAYAIDTTGTATFTPGFAHYVS